MFDSGTGKIQYITQAGVIFLVYLFVMLLLFWVLSPVVDGFFGAFNSLEAGPATDEIQTFGPYYHLACKIILAFGIAMPVTWFIFWCLHREPSQQRKRYF